MDIINDLLIITCNESKLLSRSIQVNMAKLAEKYDQLITNLIEFNNSVLFEIDLFQNVTSSWYKLKQKIEENNNNIEYIKTIYNKSITFMYYLEDSFNEANEMLIQIRRNAIPNNNTLNSIAFIEYIIYYLSTIKAQCNIIKVQCNTIIGIIRNH